MPRPSQGGWLAGLLRLRSARCVSGRRATSRNLEHGSNHHYYCRIYHIMVGDSLHGHSGAQEPLRLVGGLRCTRNP